MADSVAPASGRPLSDEDRAILELERGPIVGHTCKVVVVGEDAPDADALREAIARRIDAAPGLRWCLAGPHGALEWVLEPDLDLRRHVVEAELSEPLDRSALPGFVARVFAQRLPRDRPLWQMDVAPLAGGGAAIAWRIHHALADGSTAMRYAGAVLWEEADAGSPSRGASPRRAPNEHARDDARRRGHLARLVGRELAPGVRSPFDAPLDERREVAFASVDLRELHDAAKVVGDATLNDAMLAVVAGAVGAWIRGRGGDLDALRVRVPVSLHHLGDDPGNRDSYFVVSLPLAGRDPVERLRAVRAATAVRKREHDAEEIDALHRHLRRASPALARLCERIENGGRNFTLSVSNVPGPRGELSVLGAPVREVYSIAEIGQHHALRVAVVSAAGRLHFGICADPTVVDGLPALAAGIEAESAALVAAGRN